MYSLKQGVTVGGVQPETVVAMNVVGNIFARRKKTMVVTSLTDGAEWRTKQSLHPKGYAFDLRIWDFPTLADQEALVEEIALALGDEYDVVLESDHIHIEFDPAT